MASKPRRPSLRDFHDLQPWLANGYEKRYKQALDAGEFKLGMINPKTNKHMYDATAIDDINQYYFCFQTADMVVSFIENCLTHSKPNRFAKFPLHESQRKFFRNTFGWKRIDTGHRRYMEVFRYLPRKNSKTFDIGGVIHVGFMLDGELATEIYSVASNKMQAKLIQEAFVGSIKNDKDQPEICANGWLSKFYSIHGAKDIKAVTADNHTAVYKALASDESGAHGLNCNYALHDELHTHVDNSMFDVLQTSMGCRTEPLIVSITTADYARESFCNKKLKYAKRVCEDPNYDENFLPILYYADPEEFGDDWNDEEVWHRVNPMLGTAKNIHVMRREFKQAKNESIYENAFKRLHLNICTKSETAAYDMVQFDKGLDLDGETFKLLGQNIPVKLKDAICYGGFDAAYKWDLSAFVLDFPDHEYVLCFNWVHSKHKEIVQYKENFKHFLLTAGTEEISFDRVAEDMNKVFDAFDIIDVGFDPNQAREIIKILEEDKQHQWKCFTVAQNVRNLSEPIKHTISSIEAANMFHNGNNCFAWQLSNAEVKESNNNDYMLVKPKGIDSRTKKVDAAVALCMARARRLEAEQKPVNPYLERFKETGSYF